VIRELLIGIGGVVLTNIGWLMLILLIGLGYVGPWVAVCTGSITAGIIITLSMLVRLYEEV
jgi:hypothetical protein